MSNAIKPIRRVVTGNDEHGRSRVLYDSAAPNVNPGAIRPGTCMTDVWVYQSCPAPIGGTRDDGRLPFSFEPPEHGGHLRIVQSPAKPAGYDPAQDKTAIPLHEPRQREGGTWDRGGANAYSSPVHKSETVDYGIMLEGERVLLLDDGEYVMKPGDVVVQLGNWHGWANPREGSLMGFVMMGGRYHAIAATLFPKLGYDLMKDFSPAGLIATAPYLLVVQPALPARSVKQFIGLAKAKPGSLLYGSGGSGSPPHLVAELFRSMAKVDMVHVPYKGVTPAITDLVGGQVQAVFAVVPAAMPLVKTGRLRALGVSTARATPLVPDVPPIADGLPGFEVIGWYGLLLPSRTPAPLVARVNAELQRSLQRADIHERLTSQGAEAAFTAPEPYRTFLAREVAKWASAVRASGATAD